MEETSTGAIGVDLYGFAMKVHIVIVDSYSGFIKYSEISNTSSSEVIKTLKRWFATHGIPRILESDNGTCFTPAEFKDFSRVWGFEEVTSSPKYSQSNGLAERTVQAMKNLPSKCSLDSPDVQL